jgi:hypothetical protein
MWFTAKEAVTVTGFTAAQSVGTNPCSAAQRIRARKREECERHMKIKRRYCSAALPLFVITTLLNGCSSITSNSGTQQALVCPRCKTVETVAWLPAGPSFSRPGVSAYGVNGLYPSPAFKKHECPGCKGVIATFARQGRWEHRCSICERGTFSCSIVHPTGSPESDQR